MWLLEDAGTEARLFGGRAEELLGLAPPHRHHDVDLLYPAADFTPSGRLHCQPGGERDLGQAVPA